MLDSTVQGEFVKQKDFSINRKIFSSDRLKKWFSSHAESNSQHVKVNSEILISVHTPKCAGTSFSKWLIQAYDQKEIYWDYGDRPGDPSSFMNLDPCGFMQQFCDGYSFLENKEVVHGHFWINKYNYLPNAIRITFIRDPIARIISHYFYWLHSKKNNHILHNYFLKNNLSIIEFAQLPFIRYFYTRVFFKDADMDQFNFVGDCGDLFSEMQRLQALLKISADFPNLNNNPDRKYAERKREILSNRKIIDKLKDLLAEDILFYEKYAGR